MPGDFHQFPGNPPGGQNEIDTTRRHGTARHGIVFRRLILRESDSAFGFDGFKGKRAVGSREFALTLTLFPGRGKKPSSAGETLLHFIDR